MRNAPGTRISHTHNARIAQLHVHADFAKLISRIKLSQMVVKPRKRRMFSPSKVLCVGVLLMVSTSKPRTGRIGGGAPFLSVKVGGVQPTTFESGGPKPPLPPLYLRPCKGTETCGHTVMKPGTSLMTAHSQKKQQYRYLHTVR